MENPTFKQALTALIEENGGTDPTNLNPLAAKLREYGETFSRPRLNTLMTTNLPSDSEERRAISLVLEPPSEQWLSENWLLEDYFSRRLAKFGFKLMRSHVLAKGFVEYVLEGARFRGADHSEGDLIKLHSEYRQTRELEDEIDLFDLRN